MFGVIANLMLLKRKWEFLCDKSPSPLQGKGGCWQGCPHTSQQVQSWCPLELTGQLTLHLDDQHQLSKGSRARSRLSNITEEPTLARCLVSPRRYRVQRRREKALRVTPACDVFQPFFLPGQTKRARF